MNLPIVPPTMGYQAARILLKDGKITHRANDVICYGSRFGRGICGVPDCRPLDTDCGGGNGHLSWCGELPFHRLWYYDRQHSGGFCGGVYLQFCAVG